jgi:trans-2,3-dihydro-3-hydroxyanthranilate isomerase
MADFPFVTYDVFTDKRFSGNPLAVIFDAAGLDGTTMQTIAREFNLSETTFVSALDDPARTANVRIFTPGNEMPFAGHPVIGTAIALAHRQGAADRLDLVLELPVGTVPVTVKLDRDQAWAELSAAKLPQEAAAPADKEIIAQGLGIDSAGIGFGDHTARIFDVGPLFTMIPVSSRQVLGSALINGQAFDRAFHDTIAPFAFIYCRAGDDYEADYFARMFAPKAGVPEDPATGSAVTCLAGQLLASGDLSPGTNRCLIDQGIEMGRPSRLQLEADVADDGLQAVRLGGAAVAVSHGTIAV